MNKAAALGSRTLGRQNVSGQGQGTGISGAFIIGICEVNGTSFVEVNRLPGARLDRDRTKLGRWQTFASSLDLRGSSVKNSMATMKDLQ
jgi:hypothetical protein